MALDLTVRVITLLRWRSELADHPRIAHRLRATRRVMPVLAAREVIDRPERFPAPIFKREAAGSPEKSGTLTAPPVSWTTFGQFPANGFSRPPRTKDAPPRTVRIAFFGGSTTFDGYPEELAKIMDARFGPGKVEVLNLGVPGSWTESTLVLMRRFLPAWHPHIVVVYQGFNDLVHNLLRANILFRGPVTEQDLLRPIRLLRTGPRGLLSVLTKLWSPTQPIQPILRESIYMQAIDAYWRMSRLTWREGSRLFVSTFAAPSYSSQSLADLESYRLAIKIFWPELGSPGAYKRDLTEYNRRLSRFAARSGTALIDVAKGLDGGRKLFRDNCHRTSLGQKIHAELTFKALAPVVEKLLTAGAPRPKEREIHPATTLPGPPRASGLAARGRCVRGPCPEGACLIPGGETSFGTPDRAIPPMLRRYKELLGWVDPGWFEDDGPERHVWISPFCIDRTEVSEAARQSCVTHGRCPAFPGAALPGDIPLARRPAVMPAPLDAEAFCAYRGGRLPTEAEWEAAARGGDGRIMPWGDRWTGREANFRGREHPRGLAGDPDDGYPGPAPIGTFSGNAPHGPVDMAGNLWEWVADCFDQDVHGPRIEGSRDPIFEGDAGCLRFLRGGSFQSFAGLLERRNARGNFDVDVPGRGARCAYDFGTKHHRVHHVAP